MNVNDTDNNGWLARQFEEQRTHLRAVAYRLLGSLSEADDAVQEAWVRLSRSDTSGIENLGGWLTTVVGRVCLDQLRARKSRREESLESLTTRGAFVSEPIVDREAGNNPEDEALLADSVGLALLVILDTLTPAERLAFVLHDLFDVSFDEIAPIVGRTPTAARQLASRARRRVRQEQDQEQDAAPLLDVETDQTRQRAVVDAFLAAARGGDFAALLSLLDPEVVYRTDGFWLAAGAAREVRGAQEVAQQFAGRAQAAQPALVNGAAGFVWAPGGRPRVAFDLTITNGKIVAINLIADPAHLSQLGVVVLHD